MPEPEALIDITPWSELEGASFTAAVTKAFRIAKNDSKPWRTDAREDYDFYAGEQWSSDDVSYLSEQRRPVVTFNRSAPTIDSVSGVERANRQEVQYIPRTVEPAPDQVDDGGVAEMYTGAAKWIRDESDAEDEDSDAFQDAVITGMGWTETRISYEEEADGKIIIERVPSLEMYWDPTSYKPNLTDSRYRMRLKMVPRRAIRDLWPDAELTEAPSGVEDSVGGLFEEDEQRIGDEVQRYRDFEPVLQVQWWERQPFIRAVNPQSGKIEFITEDQLTKLQERGLQVQFVRQHRRIFYQAFLTGQTLLETGELHPSPTGEIIPGFTLMPITGKRNERQHSWFGLMRQMKDPQRWANKFFSQAQHILNTGAKGGLLAERSAFENPQEAEQKWSSPDAIIWLNEGALSGEKERIKERTPALMPPAIGDLMVFAINSIREVTGVNLEFQGLRAAGQAGVVEESRIRQGMMVLGSLFDSLRKYRKTQGRVLLHFINTYIPDGQLIRITGQNKYIQFRKDPDVIRHDVIIDDAPTSPNAKAAIWEGLKQLLPAMARAGIPIPPSVIDYAPLPASVINKIKAHFQSLQPAQQKDKQLADAQLEADVEDTKAAETLKRAQAQASIMRAETDQKGAETDAIKVLADAVIASVEVDKPTPQPSKT